MVNTAKKRSECLTAAAIALASMLYGCVGGAGVSAVGPSIRQMPANSQNTSVATKLFVINFHRTATVYNEAGDQIITTGSFPNVKGPYGIAFDSNNKHVYIANRDTNTITVYDNQGNQVTTTGRFPNICLPGAIAYDSHNHHLYITDPSVQQVKVYDEEGNQVATSGFRRPIIEEPYGIAFDSNNNHLYVVNVSPQPPSYSNFVTVFDENGNQVTTTGKFPTFAPLAYSIAYDSHNHHLYILDYNRETVTVYDEEGNLIPTTGTFPHLNSPWGIAFDPNNNHLYAANSNINTVTVYDEEGNQIMVTGSFPHLAVPVGIAVGL